MNTTDEGTGHLPNVLFIAIDDLRPELGCYGAKHIQSPNIDALASAGVLFKRAYCQAPHCAPSRSSLMTGVHTRSYEGLVMSVDQIAPGKVTLPGLFREAGYTTINAGKIFHIASDGAERSWSEPPFSLVNGEDTNNHLTTFAKESANYVNEKNGRGPFFEAPDVPDNTYIDGQTCEKVIEDLRRLAAADKPFFLGCGFVRPHLPFYAPKKYWDLYDPDTIQLADNRYRPKNAPDSLRDSIEFRYYHDRDIPYNSDEFHRVARHGYYACVSYADALVGRVLATLDELGLRDNTIVMLWGDHGWNLGEHNMWSKHKLLHECLNAPLIVSAPGLPQGVQTEAIVELIDMYPTLCELAGLPLPDHLEGESLVPILHNPDLPGKEAAFTIWDTGQAVVTRDFTYTEYKGNQHMLYDRRIDPGENLNVADEPTYAATLRDLRERLKSGNGAARQALEPGYEGEVPKATYTNVPYGDHPRHVLDLWQAQSDDPTPVVFVIHGGGWNGGSKERLSRFVDCRALLDAEVSVVAINYRLISETLDVMPPVKAPMLDAARALQFVRSKAEAWNIDPKRICAAGGSAGACTALWLAYHDDMADPASDDPVARESTRLLCAAVMFPQTTLDPAQMKAWTPNSTYGGHAFAKEGFAAFLAARDELLPWIHRYSPYHLATSNAPPVALFYGASPAMGEEQDDPTHSANFGVGLQQRCQELDSVCELFYPGAPEPTCKNATEYLLNFLGYKRKTRT